MAQAKDESEWEYEYDENETEDVYVTLEMTSAAPKRKPAGKRKTSGKPRKRTAARNPVGDDHEDDDDVGTSPYVKLRRPRGGKQPVPEPPGDANGNDDEVDDAASQGTPEPDEPENDQDDRSRIQILDLHGPSPLVWFRDRLYECHWAEPLGTTLLFARKDDLAVTDADDGAGMRTEPSPTSLRSLKDFDLLATSSVKLVANQAALQYSRNSGPVEAEDTNAMPQEPARENQPAFETSGERSNHNDAPVPHHTDPVPSDQMSFLERLRGIKERKGEEDVAFMPEIPGRGNGTLPFGWPRQRRRARTRPGGSTRATAADRGATRIERPSRSAAELSGAPGIGENREGPLSWEAITATEVTEERNSGVVGEGIAQGDGSQPRRRSRGGRGSRGSRGGRRGRARPRAVNDPGM